MNKPLATDSLIRSRDGYGCEEVVPRGYVSLMDLYENNYMRLKKLVAGLDGVRGSMVSSVPGCMDVHLEVIQHSRYTSTLRLTYLFSDAEGVSAEPDLRIRVYHDAGLVEVVAGHLKHGRQRLDHLPATARKHKWRLNRLLFKWLGYCLYLGHHFDPAVTTFPRQK